MSTAAELEVDILANTARFGPPMDEASRKLHDTFQPPPSLKELAHELHGAQQGLAAFNSLFELGLGMHVSRMFFEKIHEGLVKLGEGWQQSREFGLSWGESLLAAGGHALGLKTKLDELIETEKKSTAAAKEEAEAHQHAADAMRKRRDIAQNFDEQNRGSTRDKSLRPIDRAIQETEDKQADAKRKMDEIFAQRMQPHSKDESGKLEEEYKKQAALERQLAAERRKLMDERDREEIAVMRKRVDDEAAAKRKKAEEARQKEITEGMKINEADARMHEEIRKELQQKQEHDDRQRLEKLGKDLNKAEKEAKEAMSQKGGAVSGRAAERGSVEEAKMLDDAARAMGGNKQVELQAQTNKILEEVKTILSKDKGQSVQDLGTQILSGVASIL